MWDSYWASLSNATNGHLIVHRKQRLYLGIDPDITLSKYYVYDTKIDNDNRDEGESSQLEIEEPNKTIDTSNHGIYFQIKSPSQHK